MNCHECEWNDGLAGPHTDTLTCLAIITPAECAGIGRGNMTKAEVLIPKHARTGEFAAKIRALETYFGEDALPQPHDIKRAKDFFKKYRGQRKREQMARNMANKIKKPDKAFRRGLAFMQAGGGMSIGKIFMDRCWELTRG